MTTRPATAELMGVKEVAVWFGVPAQTVSSWFARGQMPEPLARLASGPVWDLAQIEGAEAGAEGRARAARTSASVSR